jgi:chromosome partitioning protein
MTDREEHQSRGMSIFDRLRGSHRSSSAPAVDDEEAGEESVGGALGAEERWAGSDADAARPWEPGPPRQEGTPASSDSSPWWSDPPGDLPPRGDFSPPNPYGQDFPSAPSPSPGGPGSHFKSPADPAAAAEPRRPVFSQDDEPSGDAVPNWPTPPGGYPVTHSVPEPPSGPPPAPIPGMAQEPDFVTPLPQPPAASAAHPYGSDLAPAQVSGRVDSEPISQDEVVESVIAAGDEGRAGGFRLRPEGAHPASERRLPRILAIANQKGGVGKTTTAVNLGAALAELGYRVLVVDLDPQGNATTGLGVNPRNLENSIYDVILRDVPVEDCIEPSSLRNLFVVPATIDLAGAEIELVPVFSRELRLKRALDVASSDFDYLLVDCPPSLGLLTVNGLAAAGEVVVPIQCEYYALEGLGQLLRNVNLVRSNLNPGLEVTTVILTMFDARTRLAEQVVEEVRSHFGDKVCRNVVPRTVRLSEAPSFGQPIIVFDSSSRGAIAYRELAKEVSGGAPQRVG